MNEIPKDAVFMTTNQFFCLLKKVKCVKCGKRAKWFPLEKDNCYCADCFDKKKHNIDGDE